jgi:hypothetical protein
MGSPLKKPVINLFEREDSGELLERVRTLIRNRYEQWS